MTQMERSEGVFISSRLFLKNDCVDVSPTVYETPFNQYRLATSHLLDFAEPRELRKTIYDPDS